MVQSESTSKNPDRKLAENARAELREKKLAVADVIARKSARRFHLFGPPRPRVGSKDIAVMTRQLSTMINAGIPLLQSLEILHQQASDPGFKLALDKVIDRVSSGSDFSTALADHPRLFTKIYVNMIKAGEASGQLDVILQRLADYMESIEELKREVKAAMTYPAISLILILSITVGLVVGIVPKFQGIFEQLGKENLPAPTQILVLISNALREHYLAVMAAIAAVGASFFLYIRTKPGERQWHGFLLHAPVFGPLFRKVAISRFARTFSTLIQSGVPMLGALDIVASTAGNVVVEAAVLKAKEAVTR